MQGGASGKWRLGGSRAGCSAGKLNLPSKQRLWLGPAVLLPGPADQGNETASPAPPGEGGGLRRLSPTKWSRHTTGFLVNAIGAVPPRLPRDAGFELVEAVTRCWCLGAAPYPAKRALTPFGPRWQATGADTGGLVSCYPVRSHCLGDP